jgi:hypothetical protein
MAVTGVVTKNRAANNIGKIVARTDRDPKQDRRDAQGGRVGVPKFHLTQPRGFQGCRGALVGAESGAVQ